MDQNVQQEQIQYLKKFQDFNGKNFSSWFLSLPFKGQCELLRQACPDIRVSAKLPGEKASATDVLVPEINLTSLLSNQGKSFLSFLDKRSQQNCLNSDLDYLKNLQKDGNMPIFSGDSLKSSNLSYVDPYDTEGNILSVSSNSSELSISKIKERIYSNDLVEANVWITYLYRHGIILAFLCHVCNTFETLLLKHKLYIETAEVGCRNCGSKENLLKCACNGAFYCSQAHQKEDWVNHKETCKHLRSIT